MMRTAPEVPSPFQTFAPHQRKDAWPPAYDLTYNRLHTLRIFSGIGSQTLRPEFETLPLPSYLRSNKVTYV
ncbi:hypothetical protein AVEN_24915-1, partial [Araneus ventricosus]